ncbi:oligosaccharide repeat unit polymerase [Vibrio fluvialis]|uniref:oligosaccharide repeat unit polymerase n=1 Tax=Vibrio fluvialis TaxID=676 RepID=UPI0025746CC6|nr:oligosaccharide repeat unit polymerase [Vibrio fluvialis]
MQNSYSDYSEYKHQNTYCFALILFLIFANCYAFFRFNQEGNLFVDYGSYQLKDTSWAFYDLMSIVLLFSFLYLVFRYLIERFKSCCNPYEPSYEIGLAVLIYQLCYLLFSVSTGVGHAGVDVSSSSIFNYLFLIIRPSFLFIFYFMTSKRTKLLHFNLLVYVLSMLYFGWIGVLADLILLSIAKKDFSLRSVIFSKWFVLSVVIVFFLPVIIYLRNVYRLDSFENMSLSNALEYAKLGFEGVDILVMRYQQYFSLLYFKDNLDTFTNLYLYGEISPLYSQGALPGFIYSMLSDGQHYLSLGVKLAEQSRGLLDGRVTSFTTGLVPYFYFEDGLISFVYILLLIFLIVYLLSKIRAVNTPLQFACFYYICNYLLAGWINALFSFVLCFALYVFIVRIRFVISK